MEDSAELFELVDKNRNYLKQWLPWLDHVKQSTDSENFIKSTIQQEKSDGSPTFAILYLSKIIGVIGFHPLNRGNDIGEIGYWLSEHMNGKGIMTFCCKHLVEIGFNKLKLNRIQIPAGEFNKKSRAIPERLGFKFEGIIRSREKLYGNYINHAMYSLLKNEFSTFLTKP